MNAEDRLKYFRAKITELSGSGKRVVSTRRNGIYSSFTIPALADMKAVRDTKLRFDDFKVPASLEGKTFLDVGSNVGPVSFEAAIRGAKVIGLEYRDDRVQLCRKMAEYFALDCEFYTADFNDSTTIYTRSDIVWCTSVDEYINDVPEFYRQLRQATSDTLYFESNVQRNWDEIDVYTLMHEVGFNSCRYIGNGHSGGISRKRKLFICR